MNNLYYKPIDIAAIICSFDVGCKRENEIINYIFDSEERFISAEYIGNKKKFILDTYYWMNYFYNKSTIDSEFPTVHRDLSGVDQNFSHDDYVSDYSNLDLYFKSVRLRILLNGKNDYVRIKLRTLLKCYGYKRRSERLVNHITSCMNFYGIKSYIRGGIECDFENINIDDMVTFRLADNAVINKSEVHNLDHLLDKVRTEYYHSSNLRRPTISWMDDYPTDYHGIYNYYNNHISISRILNDKRVTEEMISMVIYHESLHQDFSDHDKSFYEKMDLFPEWEKIDKKLLGFVDKAHNELQYPENFNSFTKGKKRLIYVLLPYGEEYIDAFLPRDGKILIDFEAKLDFELSDNQNDDMVVLLTEFNESYHIVGWCTNGNLLSEPQIENLSCFGDYDVCYQYVSDSKNTFVIPNTCCDYRISKELFPKKFIKNNCCCFAMDDEEILPDIKYINSYCEGYWKQGFDMDNIDCIPDFNNISLEDIKRIDEKGYRGVWLANAIYKQETTVENLIKRAVVKKDCWLLSASLDDFFKANQLYNSDAFCIGEIIKLCVVLNRIDEATEFYVKYKDVLSKIDEYLNNCIDYLKKENKF